MPIIQTERHDDHWIAKLPGPIPELDKVAQGATELEAVVNLAYLSSDASLVLSKEADYWLTKYKPKTDQEAVDLLHCAFGIS